MMRHSQVDGYGLKIRSFTRHTRGYWKIALARCFQLAGIDHHTAMLHDAKLLQYS